MKNIAILTSLTLLLSGCSPGLSTKISQTTGYIQTIQETIAPKPTVILPSGLPNKHLIKTAFIPQAPEKNWDEPWQDACEEAALLTVKYYYLNKTPSLETLLSDYQQIFSFEGQNNWASDINLSQMSQISSTLFNLKPTVVSNPSLEDIKKYLSEDVPVVITANGKTLFKENSHFKSGGPWYHSLVILGYDDNTSKFTVHDVGTQFGAYYKYSYNLLLDSIHDFPGSGQKEQVDSGDKKVLVLIK